MNESVFCRNLMAQKLSAKFMLEKRLLKTCPVQKCLPHTSFLRKPIEKKPKGIRDREALEDRVQECSQDEGLGASRKEGTHSREEKWHGVQ